MLFKTKFLRTLYGLNDCEAEEQVNDRISFSNFIGLGLHFGYKRHTVTDENGLVIAEETTATNESDIKHPAHLEEEQKREKQPNVKLFLRKSDIHRDATNNVIVLHEVYL